MSLVGFSSRSYRSSSRRPRFGGGARRTSVVKTSASSSLPQWAIEQHQELLAARDKEAWAKLAAGATEEFIQYAEERIAATTDETTRAAWNGFVTTAKKNLAEKAAVEGNNRYIANLQEMAYDVQAGERAAEDFISYLESQRDSYPIGDPKRTAILRALSDAKGWAEAYSRAAEKRHDEEMAASLANGEVTLEDALSYVEGRRANLKPGDEAYANLTQQIANLKTGIDARDFNAEMQKANAALVAANNSPEAKQDYLGKLVELTTRAKSAAAQTALTTQIKSVREAIQKDQILEQSRALNSVMVDYYAGKKTATEALAFLTKRAADAVDPTEANRYTSMAAQIVSRENQLARQAGGGSSGGAGNSTWVNTQLEPFERDYKKALDAVDDAAQAGEVLSRDDPRWKNYERAARTYGSALDQIAAFPGLNTAGRESIDTRVGTVGDDARVQVTKFGENVVAQIADLKLQIEGSAKKMAARASDPDGTVVSSLVRDLAELEKLRSNPFLTTTNQKRDALRNVQGANAEIGTLFSKAADAYRGTTPAMKSIEESYAQYVDKWQEAKAKNTRGLGLAPAELDVFMENALKLDAKASDLKKALGISITPEQISNLRKWDRQDDELSSSSAQTAQKLIDSMYAEVKARPELQGVMKNFLETNGLMDLPNATVIYGDLTGDWAAGGRLDESTRAAARAGGMAGPQGGMGKPLADVTDIYGGVQNMFGNGMFAPPEQRAPDVVQYPGTEAAASGGPQLTEFSPGEGPSSPEPPPDINEFQNAQRANQAQQEDPYAAGWAFLMTPVTLDTPTFELPPLPVEGDFIGPHFDPGFVDTSWELPAGMFDSGLGGYNPNGASFDPGFSFDIPSFDDVNAGGSQGSMGNAGSGPMLTP